MNERKPPYSEHAEASVIGGILLRNDAMDKVIERGVKAEDFYLPAHRAIYLALVVMRELNQPMDVLTVANQLKIAKTTETHKGIEGILADVVSRVVTAENIGFYAKIVRDHGERREFIELTTNLTGRAYADVESTPDLVVEAAKRLTEISDQGQSKGYSHIGFDAMCTVEIVERRSASGSSVTGVSSGYFDLDRLTAGFQPADLIILAARPSVGKTALALNIARNCDVPSLLLSIEMSRAALLERLISCEGRIQGQRLRTGQLADDEWPILDNAAASVSALPICVDDEAPQTLSSITIEARKWRKDVSVFPDQAGDEPGLIIIDYLQLIDTQSRNGESRDRALGRCTGTIKALAKSLKLPVLVLSQLNRGLEKREDKRPTLADLRESGAIEQDADLIMFLHKNEKKIAKPEIDYRTTELIVGKQRNGPVGIVSLIFDKAYGRFENYEHEQPVKSKPSVQKNMRYANLLGFIKETS